MPSDQLCLLEPFRPRLRLFSVQEAEEAAAEGSAFGQLPEATEEAAWNWWLNPESCQSLRGR